MRTRRRRGRRARRRPGRPSCPRARAAPSRPRPARAPCRGSGRACASLSTRPSASRTPQWPWSVNSSRQRSVCTTRASPTSATSARVATLRMPSGSVAPEPTASRSARDAEEHDPADAGRGGLSRGALRRSRAVCCTTPGIEEIGDGLGDALAHEHGEDQLGRVEPRLGDEATDGRRLPETTGTGHGNAHQSSLRAAADAPSRFAQGVKPVSGSASPASSSRFWLSATTRSRRSASRPLLLRPRRRPAARSLGVDGRARVRSRR